MRQILATESTGRKASVPKPAFLPACSWAAVHSLASKDMSWKPKILCAKFRYVPFAFYILTSFLCELKCRIETSHLCIKQTQTAALSDTFYTLRHLSFCLPEISLLPGKEPWKHQVDISYRCLDGYCTAQWSVNLARNKEFTLHALLSAWNVEKKKKKKKEVTGDVWLSGFCLIRWTLTWSAIFLSSFWCSSYKRSRPVCLS